MNMIDGVCNLAAWSTVANDDAGPWASYAIGRAHGLSVLEAPRGALWARAQREGWRPVVELDNGPAPYAGVTGDGRIVVLTQGATCAVVRLVRGAPQLHRWTGPAPARVFTPRAPYAVAPAGPAPTATVRQEGHALALTLRAAVWCPVGSPIPRAVVVEAGPRTLVRGVSLLTTSICEAADHAAWRLRIGVRLTVSGEPGDVAAVFTHADGRTTTVAATLSSALDGVS